MSKLSTSAATGTNGVTVSSVTNGTTRLRSANMALLRVNHGQAFSGQQWLTLDQSGRNAAGQTVTIDLGRTVSCVTFYLNDIDTQYLSGTSRYRDQVSVSGFLASTTSGYVTTSSGTAIPTNTATSASKTTYEFEATTSVNGLVKFTAQGPISSITLTHTNANAGSGTGVNDNAQQVYISPLQYSTTPCAC